MTGEPEQPSRGGLLRVATKANPQDSRQTNRSFLLQMLFAQGAMSRAELARVSGLARPTVSALVAQLTSEGLVAEYGPSDGGVAGRAGKKGTLVGIRVDDFQVIAIDLSAGDRVTGALTDLYGTVEQQRELPFNGATGEDAISLVFDLVDDLTHRATRIVIGIGVATPGIVDNHGVVRIGARLNWYDVPLSERISEHSGIPSHVTNDSRAVALGVHAFLPTNEPDLARRNLMAVTIEQGVGAGIIVGGSLLEGSQFAAGEIGHVTVDEHGDVCECGRVGCLDAAVSATRLRARIDAAEPGSRGAILDEVGRSLGQVLAPIVSALDLSEVVLCGPPDLIEGPLLRAVFTTVRGRNLAAVSHGISMTFAGSGHELALLGATALVLSQVLDVA